MRGCGRGCGLGAPGTGRGGCHDVAPSASPLPWLCQPGRAAFSCLQARGRLREGAMKRGRGGRRGGTRLQPGWGMHKGRKKGPAQAQPRSAARWRPLAWKCCKETRREGRARRDRPPPPSSSPPPLRPAQSGAAGSGVWGQHNWVPAPPGRSGRNRAPFSAALDEEDDLALPGGSP